MKSDEIIILSQEGLKEIMEKEPRFKQVLKGYSGEVASVTIADKPMLVPHIPKLIDQVLFVWAMVLFGAKGSTPTEKVICNEINKCLNGKIYSVKKLAEAAEGLPAKAKYFDYDSATIIKF